MLRTFETEDAKYYLGLGSHSTSSNGIFNGVNFSTLDFMVFEDCGGKEGEKRVLENYLVNHPQYKEVYERASHESPLLKIYGVDININPRLRLLETIIQGTGLACTIQGIAEKNLEEFLIGSFVSNETWMGMLYLLGIKPKTIWSFYSTLSSVFPNWGSGYRNAVTAKKVSEYLVPKHKNKNKKSEATLLYGALHSGIEADLKHPQRYNRTIKFYHDLCRLTTKESLNEIRETVRNKDGSLKTIYHNANLF